MARSAAGFALCALVRYTVFAAHAPKPAVVDEKNPENNAPAELGVYHPTATVFAGIVTGINEAAPEEAAATTYDIVIFPPTGLPCNVQGVSVGEGPGTIASV